MNHSKRLFPSFCHWIIFCGLLWLLANPGADVGAQDSADGHPERIEITGTTMGPIPYSVIVIKDQHTPSETVLANAVEKSLEHVNNLMSTYKPDSDISRFNLSKSTDWLDVHPDTAKVVARSLEISKQTKGAFDVTVGPAVNLWHFGPNKERKFTIPSEAAIEAVRAIVGWERLEVRLDPPSLKKSVPNLQIDLSAIAKGYAVDQVAENLVHLSCHNVLVEVGGEVAAIGRAAPNKCWRVGVEKPFEGFQRDIAQVAELENRALATSGDYRNFNIVDGKRYAHSIDPSSCVPAQNDLATACVIAEDCMTADAYATAVMVMGPSRGWELCRLLNMPLLIIERDLADPLNPERFKKKISADFPVLTVGAEAKQSAGIVPVFISATVVFALAILGMAAGAIFGNKRLSGSCGGLANMQDGETACSLCKEPTSDCVEANSGSN